MPEYTITRHNPLVDPALHVWGWPIPVYLFLGGLVAGLMIVTGYLQLTRPRRDLTGLAMRLPAIALVLISAGMLALFIDLEHQRYVWRLYTTFQPTSVMSWGAWILLLVYPVLAASVLLPGGGAGVVRSAVLQHLWQFERWVARGPRAGRAIGVANVTLGIALGIYTGILLGTLGARPLWSSGVLGPLFLLSGLSSAVALVHWLTRDRRERDVTERVDAALLAAELVVILLWVLGLATGDAAQAAAASLLLGGPFTAAFWVLVVGAGIAVPLLIQVLRVAGRIEHAALAPALVLGGGLALRVVVVYAGQASEWIVAAAR